jgi:hypothetical protein
MAGVGQGCEVLTGDLTKEVRLGGRWAVADRPYILLKTPVNTPVHW